MDSTINPAANPTVTPDNDDQGTPSTGGPDCGSPERGSAPVRRGERKRPGPVPGVPTQRYTLLLEEELGEWGKRQPGGLSDLVRGLLRRAKQEAKSEAQSGT